MNAQANRPVLLFAFAGEDSTIQVEAEARAVKAALSSVAGTLNLCELEIPPFLKLADIADVFQKNRDRVAVFHYAGHATGAELLLRTALGTGAGAAGLSALIRGQSGLKLVFLNGCSTERQVDSWIAAGVPCVIATSQAIHGEVAKNFAVRFYHGLATGASIRTAYDEAVGETTAACHGKTRLLYADEDSPVADESHHGHWPWFMRTAPGAETVEDWNLPDAAGDPLALLPLRLTGPLPECPYPGLRRFTAADAAVFFGRGQAIRRLYERVTSAQSAPIILLHGQSGVGKSSILEAGLAPRLQWSNHQSGSGNGSGSHGDAVNTPSRSGEDAWEVVTIRLDPVRGVLDSLRLAFVEEAFCEDGTHRRSCDAWRAKEERLKKPLLVILDQVEEAFTHARGGTPADWDLFVSELSRIFADRTQAPRGKVILSFRTEWYSRIYSRLPGLWKSEVFLDCLDAAGIHEATEGPTRNRMLREQYPLTIQPGLALRIATELLMDSETSVAPTLQILLRKLWDQATLESRTPVFDEPLYRRHRATLGDFVRTQIQKIADHASVTSATRRAIDAGLLLDFLECHVTPELTSRHQLMRVLLEGDSKAVPAIAARYPGRGEIIRELRALCIDHYLLVQPDSGTNAEPEPSSRLAHDSLAAHIHAIYEASDASGPRARRILEQRVSELSLGGDVDLEPSALRAIEQGRAGMRAWTPTEEQMVRTGRRNRLIRRTSVVSFAVVLVAGLLWMRLDRFRSEVRNAFLVEADQIETLYDLADASPWVSTRLAHEFFQEERPAVTKPAAFRSASDSDAARLVTKAADAGQTAPSEVNGNPHQLIRDRRRRGLRAAMVMVHLKRAEDQHIERLLRECRSFSSVTQGNECRIVREVLTSDDCWNTFVEARPQVSSLVSDLVRDGNPPVVTALLLAAGRPERIPAAWYRPSANQTVRTRNTIELTRWLTVGELLDLLEQSGNSDLDAKLGRDSADDLRAVLQLAIAEASPDVLTAWLETVDPGNPPDLESACSSPSAVVRSASRLLLSRLSNLSPRLFRSPAELDAVNQLTSKTEPRQLVVLECRSQHNWARICFEPHDSRGQTLSTGLDFLQIPAGDQTPGYWMSATEVPVSVFHEFLNDPNLRDLKAGRYVAGMTPFKDERPENAANYVTWEEAVNFCNWLNSALRLKPCYLSDSQTSDFPYISTGESTFIDVNADGFRLPRTDEWVHACRAQSVTRFSFDDNFESDQWETLGRHAWFLLNSGNSPKPCASRLPNAWGLFDMHGGLCEWCCETVPTGQPGKPPQVRPEVRSSDFQTPFQNCTSDEITPVIDGRARDSQLMGFRLVISEIPIGTSTAGSR